MGRMGRPKGFAATTDRMNPEIHKEISRLGGLLNKKRHVFTPEQRSRGGRSKGPRPDPFAEAASIQAAVRATPEQVAQQVVRTQGTKAALAILDKLEADFNEACEVAGVAPIEEEPPKQGLLAKVASMFTGGGGGGAPPSSGPLETPAELAARLREESAAVPRGRLEELRAMRERLQAEQANARAAAAAPSNWGLDDDDFD